MNTAYQPTAITPDVFAPAQLRAEFAPALLATQKPTGRQQQTCRDFSVGYEIDWTRTDVVCIRRKLP